MFFGTESTSVIQSNNYEQCSRESIRTDFVQVIAQHTAICILSVSSHAQDSRGTVRHSESVTLIAQKDISPRTMNCSKLGRHHCARHSLISQPECTPCSSVNCPDMAVESNCISASLCLYEKEHLPDACEGASFSSNLRLRPTSSPSPGLR